MKLSTILASGAPLDRLASGTAICQQQKAAILVYVPHTSKFHSATVYLGTELLKENHNVTFSLCPSLHKPCLETASFALPATKRIEATWESTKNPELKSGSFVWFVVEGNSPTFDHSFTWYDAASFNHTTAYNDGKWTVEKGRVGASTIEFIVQ
ncbi:hypothetical protein HDV01_006598 [Terramyces sp. JEL0728]|nr:hypothetical protein HDV01_006598 [Terramyces sp. JEL0728]